MSYPNRGNQHLNNRKRNKGKKNQNVTNVARAYNLNLKARFTNFKARFQAPHQDELVDLTDDLAPKVSAPSVAPAQGPAPTLAQPRSASSDNKLNFKFQKTMQKTPDWSKYQDNFKRISAASPDTDPEETQVDEQNTQSKGDQQAKTTDVNTATTSQASQSQSDLLARLPPSVMKVVQEKLKQLPTHKTPIIMPKVEEPVVEKPKPQEQKKVAAVKLKPIEVKLHQNKNTKHEKYFLKQYVMPYDYLPKGVAGIPRSFLIEKERKEMEMMERKEMEMEMLKAMDVTAAPPNPNAPMPTKPAYDYQPKGVAGIPRSFLIEKEKKEMEMEMLKAMEVTAAPPNPNTPMPTKPVSEQKPLYSLDLPSWILPTPAPENLAQKSIYDDLGSNTGANPPTYGQSEPVPDRPYSPSDAYTETAGKIEEESRDGSESPDILPGGQKRLSAFKRLGPLNITKPKKPKLTINLMINKEQNVREVVDEGTESHHYVPVHLRRDVLQSKDETVTKYLPFWPWKKNITMRKTVSARYSKSVMLLEQEQMEAGYEKDSAFIQVSIRGYPATWTKEDVLDAVLECVKGKSLIPCFIEFTSQECKFLVIRCRAALIAIHKVGFHIRKDETELTVFISLTDLSLNQIDMIPRLALRKRLMTHYDGESQLDLTTFFLEKDVSHFVYFPLNRVTNQVELIQLQSAVNWEYLTDLNLSRNRLTTLDGFDLQTTAPRLKRLDLSHNYLDKLTLLLRCRDLPLRAIRLEGNPLCHDYIDSDHYVKVLKMMFCELKEIDGIPLIYKGQFPPMKRNCCPEDAQGVVAKFLETFFPLLEAPYDDRAAIEDLYDEDAVMTVTFRHKLRYGSTYRYFRNLFQRAHNVDDGEWDSVRGAPAIGGLVGKWPAVQHDRYTFAVDVLHHDDSTTIFRVGGILKLTAESLAEDEHLLTFTRNIVLHTKNGSEYKIHNELLYWDVPSEESLLTAFNITTIRSKVPTLKLGSPPDEDLKSKLLNIFVKLADIDKKRGERCLEIKNWDLRGALEHYIRLLKLDDLSSLKAPEETPEPVALAS